MYYFNGLMSKHKSNIVGDTFNIELKMIFRVFSVRKNKWEPWPKVPENVDKIVLILDSYFVVK